MVFSSYSFLFLFLPILLIFYFSIKNRTYRNLILFIFSLFFYAWGEPRFIILMIFSIINDYIHAILIEKNRKKINVSKILLFSSIFINVGLLAVFKYSGFIVNNFNAIFNLGIENPNILLPIGISFYTFQTMSYTIDVYHEKIKAQKNFLTLATYVALFPQLIAGPIVRYSTIENELSDRKESAKLFVKGTKRFVIGLAKKVIIANNVAIIADAVFDSKIVDIGTNVAWLGLIAYALQIYFDFSGYSDMAIGLGNIFGFHFLENFDYPYISKSITDFWRRWHISLSSWFRDYVYIPLGGNRVKPFRWLINIFIVWFATGLWHGASWNYVIWGLYFAIILVIEKKVLSKILNKIPKVFQHIYAVFLFLMGWVIFRIENLDKIGLFLKELFIYHKSDLVEFYTSNSNTLSALPYIFLGIIGSTPLIKNIINKTSKKSFGIIINDIFTIILFILSITFLLSSSYNPFIYFRF